MCLADDDLVGGQLSPGTSSSLPCDKVVSNQLSLYSSFLALQAQHASSGHDKIIISALRNSQNDEPKEEKVQPMPSFFDNWILQHSELGTDNEIETETTPPVKRVTRSKSRMAACVFPEVYEPPSDDDSGPEGSLTGSDAAEAPAVRIKKACSKGTSTTDDQRRGRTSTSTTAVEGNPRFMWDVPMTTCPRLQYLARLPSRLDQRTSRAGE
jgi:hypothetical protein